MTSGGVTPASVQTNEQHGRVQSSYLLQMQGITKQFPGCLANDNIDLQISPGEIHALLGQNGAGKSTLVKIIYGILQADAGSLRWQEEEVVIANPATARAHGIAMVFQHFSLFESLSVIENIALGLRGDSRSGKPTSELRQQALDVSNRYGLPLDPDRLVYTLSVGEKQRIEIIRCLLQSPKLLIMDEPTSVLTPQEIDTLFETLRKLAAEGMAILYISHKLDEIRELCSGATILRQGRKVAMADPTVESSESLAAMMIGETTARVQRETDGHGPAVSSTLLGVSGLTLKNQDSFGVSLREVSFEVRAGEVLGIAGVAGNGQDELLMALSGETKVKSADTITLRGDSIAQLAPRQRRRLGICVIPEERLGHAAVPDMALYQNAVLTGFARLPLARFGWISRKASYEFADRIVEKYDVMCPNTDVEASSLSGGNLQKFVVGREIEQRPDVLVVAQPTWGVDAGAAATIRRSLLSLAANGAGVLVISQDLDELLQIGTRIMAICGGRVSAAYPATSLDSSAIGILMGGGELSQQVGVDNYNHPDHSGNFDSSNNHDGFQGAP